GSTTCTRHSVSPKALLPVGAIKIASVPEATTVPPLPELTPVRISQSACKGSATQPTVRKSPTMRSTTALVWPLPITTAKTTSASETIISFSLAKPLAWDELASRSPPHAKQLPQPSLTAGGPDGLLLNCRTVIAGCFAFWANDKLVQMTSPATANSQSIFFDISILLGEFFLLAGETILQFAI